MTNSPFHYLDLIAEHLSENHAAVLVGAGFSRNAIPIGGTKKKAPLWTDLANSFIDRLSPDKKSKDIYQNKDPLLLAEYVEALYGRDVLNQILQKSIRDQDFLPSSVHKKLLELPWTDVYTTNYDTLLERTAEGFSVDEEDKRFLIVKTIDDLIGSSGRKRIIKLHGSFPSNYPFIVTTEDYRTYPQKFAPFVNTVQQCIIENTLCLMGFSGTDPNFEKWIGWIRDNLGIEKCQNIYLFLIHEPTEAEQELLHRRKIIPVILSKLFPEEKDSPQDLYERTLSYLQEKVNSFTEIKRWDIKFNIRFNDSLENALVLLKRNHESYPGWFLMPLGTRDRLKNTLDNALQVLKSSYQKQIASKVLLEYLYEYDWLREIVQVPMSKEAEEIYNQILDSYEKSDLNDKFTKRWHISILLSLMRKCRENYEKVEWNCLNEKILKYSEECQLFSDRYNWECAQFYLSELDIESLTSLLPRWNPSIGSEWSLRKTSLLLEIGELANSIVLIKNNIRDIRLRLQSEKDDLHLLSLESAFMKLEKILNSSKKILTFNQSKDDEQPRYIKNPSYDFQKETSRVNTGISEPNECAPNTNSSKNEEHQAKHLKFSVDWSRTNEQFISDLNKEQFNENRYSVNYSFDFGRSSARMHFTNNPNYSLALSFLRFREESGIPFHINNIPYDTEAAEVAAKCLSLMKPHLSLLTLIRSNNYTDLEKIFNRVILSQLDLIKIDEMLDFCTSTLSRVVQRIDSGKGKYTYDILWLAANVIPETISVLLTRCSKTKFNGLFDLLVNIYSSTQRDYFSHCQNFIKRLVIKLIPQLGVQTIEKLFHFDYGETPNIRDEFQFPDPFWHALTFNKKLVQRLINAQPLSIDIDSLLTRYEKQHQEWLLSRLLLCNEYNLLSREQQKRLKEFVLVKGNVTLPSGWSIFTLLHLDCVEEPGLQNIVNNKFIESVKKYSNSKSFSSESARLFSDFLLLTTEETIHLSLEQIQEIWKGLGARIEFLISTVNSERTTTFWGIQAKSEIYRILEFLWLLIKKEQIESKETLKGIDISRLKALGITHIGFNSIFDESKQRESLISTYARYIHSGDELTREWNYRVLQSAVLFPDLKLLNEKDIKNGLELLSQQIAWCAGKELPLALAIADSAIQNRLNLCSAETIRLLIYGLKKLISLTEINDEDSIESANKKGELRVLAANLAKSMHANNQIARNDDGTISSWIKLIENENEFVEVRNVACMN